MTTTINIGEKIKYGKGFYSDEIECLKDKRHTVLWWQNGVWCLNCNGYVKAKVKES